MSATYTAPDAHRIRLVEFKPAGNGIGALRGFAVVDLPVAGLPVHLRIRDVPVLAQNGKAWIALPGKPLLSPDGVALRDPNTGKIRYAPVLEWPDKQVASRFSTAVIRAIEAEYPGVTGDIA